LEKVKSFIKIYRDFPKKGIQFQDIHPLLADHEGREIVLQHLLNRYKDKGIQVVTGMESRGYYFGIPLAFALKVPFVPLRKPKKLPGELSGIDYGLEYGTDRLEIQTSMIKADKVLIVDDLLATGGTAAAACELIKICGGEVVECCFIIELMELNGRNKAPKDVPYYSVLQL